MATQQQQHRAQEEQKEQRARLCRAWSCRQAPQASQGTRKCRWPAPPPYLHGQVPPWILRKGAGGERKDSRVGTAAAAPRSNRSQPSLSLSFRSCMPAKQPMKYLYLWVGSGDHVTLHSSAARKLSPNKREECALLPTNIPHSPAYSACRSVCVTSR